MKRKRFIKNEIPFKKRKFYKKPKTQVKNNNQKKSNDILFKGMKLTAFVTMKGFNYTQRKFNEQKSKINKIEKKIDWLIRQQISSIKKVITID